jgi:anthraniloyl-CoA monooxygenase
LRIATIGGGPGGLYASLLLKRSSPELDITVFEKNPRGATYGWGVVFSDRTLTSFREADYKSYVQITDDFVIWDAIDVRYKGTVMRAGGQVFSGIARRRLLDILTRRCLEVGVEVRFEAEVHPGEADDYDLVIAADGIHSATRTRKREHFRPRISEGASRYIWFGTTLALDSFTFIFRSNEDGLFQVHAYPFDGTTSTFIVECDERTWRVAGLDRSSEAESIAYCEKLFAEDLRGNSLMSNQSKWMSFPTLKTKTWVRRGEPGTAPVVLLGDSVHTAHFSIGSGTKLAMEDAISLANAFEERGAATGDPHSIEATLADYQMERKPIVERFQEAADQSQSYFESTRRYQELDPEQFVFHLLTRSGRIDYGNLRLRDPYLIERVDRSFSTRAGGHDRAVVAPPPALVAFDLGGVRLPNRAVLSPVAAGSSENGIIAGPDADGLRDALSALPGLVVTDEVAVSARGRITPGDAGLWNDDQMSAWQSLLDGRSTPVAARLNHSGPRGATRPRFRGLDRPLAVGGWRLLAASEIAYGRNTVPQMIDERTHDEVLGDFASAAARAGHGGFDAVVVEMGRGYLLATFLSPLTNRRADDFGGDRERRMGFPLEVFDAVNGAFDGPVCASVCADDWQRGGATIEDAMELVSELQHRGCALVEVTAGFTTPRFTPHLDPYYLTVLSEQVRNECSIPTMVGGDITTVDRINTLLGGARADLCVLRPRR